MTEQWQHTYLERDKKRELRLKLSYSFAKLQTYLPSSLSLALSQSYALGAAAQQQS